MTEENKAIARRVYEIVSSGDFQRAREIVDPDAPDNELLPDDPPAKLIDTFVETFSEAREGFPDLSITIEDVMAEGDRGSIFIASGWLGKGHGSLLKNSLDVCYWP
jgi:predicted ester cyclase